MCVAIHIATVKVQMGKLQNLCLDIIDKIWDHHLVHLSWSMWNFHLARALQFQGFTQFMTVLIVAQEFKQLERWNQWTKTINTFNRIKTTPHRERDLVLILNIE